ncbi:unnamed protein product [Urochloa humidicola]
MQEGGPPKKKQKITNQTSVVLLRVLKYRHHLCLFHLAKTWIHQLLRRLEVPNLNQQDSKGQEVVQTSPSLLAKQMHR